MNFSNLKTFFNIFSIFNIFGISIIFIISGLNLSVYAEVHTMDIVVEASKDDSGIKNLPVGVQVINSEDIEKFNPTSVADILNFQAGITEAGKQGEFGSNSTIRIRGNGANYSLVLLDGQPINSSSLGNADLSFLDIEMIDRIEIMKGPYSTVLGNGAVGGVVNIITKDGYKTYIKTEAGSYGYNSFILNSFLNIDKTSLNINFDLGNYAGFRDNSGYNSKNIFLKLNQEIGFYQNLAFRYVRNTKNIENPGSNPTAIKDYDGTKERKATTPNDKLESDNQYIQADYSIVKHEIGDFDFKIYNNINQSINKDVSINKDETFKDTKYGFETRFASTNDWLLGYQLEYDESKDDKNSANIYNYYRNIHSFYLQKTIKTDAWINSLGARYDYTADYGDGFSPKFTSIYNFDDNVRLSLNIAKSFRILSFSEIFYTGNRLKYKYEDGYGGDFGINFGLFDKKVDCQIVYFMQEIDNKISWADWMNPVQTQSSESKGFETSFGFKTGIFDNLINYTYTDAKSKETATSAFLKDMYVPYSKLSYNFGGNINDKILFGIVEKYTGEQSWQDSFSKYYLNEYWLTDVSITRKFKRFDVFLTISNLFDQPYQSRIGYPTAGREFKVGAKFDF